MSSIFCSDNRFQNAIVRMATSFKKATMFIQQYSVIETNKTISLADMKQSSFQFSNYEANRNKP